MTNLSCSSSNGSRCQDESDRVRCTLSYCKLSSESTLCLHTFSVGFYGLRISALKWNSYSYYSWYKWFININIIVFVSVIRCRFMTLTLCPVSGWPDQKVKNQKTIRNIFCEIRNKSESVIFCKLVGIMLTCWCRKLCRVSAHLLILYFQRYFTIKKDNTMNICLVNAKKIEDTLCWTFSLKSKLNRGKKDKKTNHIYIM